jgi:hypothetical protein
MQTSKWCDFLNEFDWANPFVSISPSQIWSNSKPAFAEEANVDLKSNGLRLWGYTFPLAFLFSFRRPICVCIVCKSQLAISNLGYPLSRD